MTLLINDGQRAEKDKKEDNINFMHYSFEIVLERVKEWPGKKRKRYNRDALLTQRADIK